jgi:hypothetical protein
MIRVILRGRIGNNLFQYAVGRMLADRHGTQLILDASQLNLKAWSDSSSMMRLPIRGSVLRKLPLAEKVLRKLTRRRRLTIRKMLIVREAENETFNPTIVTSPDDSLLIGFFQSPLYFESITNSLRSEIDLGAIDWTSATSDFGNRLSAGESVSVHVRRTDYVGSDEWNVCSMNYYSAAMARMRDILDKPKFYIFSDEPSWCTEQFKSDDQIVVNSHHLANDPLHDLYLMSKARHHIITNSSYSWWGAWMGKKDGQRVISPSRWTNGATRFPIHEKLCEGWEVIKHL